MNITMTVKAEELYKALKEIEDEGINGFEMVYIYQEAGVFHLEVFISEDTQEWYEGDDHSVEFANFGKFWRPFADVEEIDYIISFTKTARDSEEFIEIEFGDNFTEFRTSQVSLYIDKNT